MKLISLVTRGFVHIVDPILLPVGFLLRTFLDLYLWRKKLGGGSPWGKKGKKRLWQKKVCNPIKQDLVYLFQP
jgi:hypothetical protein